MVDAQTVSSKIADMKKKIESFTQAFSTTTTNLITKMGELSDKLKMISASSEILPKIKIQHSENNRLLQKLDSSLTGLMRRLNMVMY
ncbi:MAG: hypothetical protein ACTSU5_16975 [Promethearchaeota archaeon]